MIYRVKDFGAIADGKTLCVKALQETVDFCHAKGSGVVRFDTGKYVLSAIFLKSNVVL